MGPNLCLKRKGTTDIEKAAANVNGGSSKRRYVGVTAGSREKKLLNESVIRRTALYLLCSSSRVFNLERRGKS